MAEQYSGPERRKFPRTQATFVVSYRIKDMPDEYDLTQTRDVSQGGILITTNRFFGEGVHLKITIRFPFVPQKIEATGEVVESREVVKNVIYETRIRFIDLDMSIFEDIGKYIEKLLAKKKQ